MSEFSRRAFLWSAASLPLVAVDPAGAAGQSDSEPRLEHRDARNYAAIRVTLSMAEMAGALPKLWQEVFGWLGKHGVSQAGPPMIRYLVIDMARRLELEVGVPVAHPVKGDGRVRAGVLPAGRYAVLIHTGPYDGLVAANAALQAWAKKKGIRFQAHQTKHGTAWRSRVETYPLGPREQPDPKWWLTHVAYLVAERGSG